MELPFNQAVGSFDPQNFNHNAGGSNNIAGDELNNAVDGTLQLTGTLENIQFSNVWTADLLTDGGGNPILSNGQFVARNGTARRTIRVIAEVHCDGGALLPQLSDATVIFSATYNNIPFANTTGTHGAGYDFVGDSSTSYDASMTFQVAPEPATLSLLILGGLAALRRRR